MLEWLKWLKEVLVESFVGAIGLGLLLSTVVVHLANGLLTPLTNWLVSSEFRGFPNRPVRPFALGEGLPELIRAFVLLLIWGALLYWLYYKRVPEETPTEPSDAQES